MWSVKTLSPYLQQAADLGIAAGALLSQLDDGPHGRWLSAGGFGAGILLRMANHLACQRQAVRPLHPPPSTTQE